MKKRPYGILLIASALCISFLTASTQTKYRQWETEFLNAVVRDTASMVSAFLPDRYSFGVRTPEGGRLMLVKDGAFNRLLMEGTHRTFEILLKKGKPQVDRIDSTHFHGDNYDMIAFRRKDTLYQYGGYGNWVLRDFLTRYRESSRDWEYVRSNGKLLENRCTPFQYVSKEDRLYVFGSEEIDHRDLSRSTRDSLFSYDFKTHRWEALNPIRNVDGILPHTPAMGRYFCSFGKGVLFTHDGKPVIADLSKGVYKLLESESAVSGRIRTIGTTSTQDSVLRLVLSDTLHEFFLEDGIGIHTRRHLGYDSIMRKEAKYFYVAAEKSDAAKSFSVVLLFLAAVASFLFFSRGGSSSHSTDGSPGSEAPSRSNAGHLDASEELRGDDESPYVRMVKRARGHLTNAEWELLRRMAALSSEGVWMDASTANQLLGVSEKSADIQKSKRNLSFKKINRVFTGLGLEGGPLIAYNRSESDKRSYRYSIDRQTATALHEAIGSL